MKSGIYKIVNKDNDKYYLGSSCNIFDNRFKNHKSLLRKNKHFNKHLQDAWNKYGEEKFIFSVIENVIPEFLLEIEQKYLNIAREEQHKCYNQVFTAGRGPGLKKGTKFSKAHIENLRHSHLGQKSWNKGQTKETNLSLMKISCSKKGKSNTKIAKEYLFIDPNKNIKTITNLKKFCEENNLTYTTMNLLFHGKGGYKSHKGWMRYV